ncbi:MAG: FKBP-type peptidyl-prolyl cis-trans isomerase [bacterium]|nr:FKBP-type peptidyl-prolyl cis-trans isomerase [bacterium]
MKIFILGVLAIVILGVAGFMFSEDKAPKEQDNKVTEQEQVMPTNELKIEDTVVGEGKEAVAGKVISVHYTGTLQDGTKFDSSRDRGTPFEFTLGAGQVIQGWEQGFTGMKVGGKRKLTIPSDLAYGPAGIPGAIPGNATLLFDVELLSVAE